MSRCIRSQSRPLSSGIIAVLISAISALWLVIGTSGRSRQISS